MELISVIVPIYKAEKYIDRCIASIAGQTYTNLEIILVDDGSPDKSGDICDQWARKDARVKVIHQNNSGVSVARNAGVANANGKYIMMLDSDDYMCPQMIESMYQIMMDQVVDMVICGFEKGNQDAFVFNDSNIKTVEIINAPTALKRIYDGDEKALQYVAPWAKLYQKEMFEGIYYPEGKIFEDIYVTHQLLFQCDKIAVTEAKLIYYYQHPDSIMNKKFHVGKLDYLDALKQRIAFYKQHELSDLASIAYDEYLHSLIWEYSRARDLLANKDAMDKIRESYHEAYEKGYCSKRYPKETTLFLRAFDLNPEFIITYWKIAGKLKSMTKGRKK